jgi:tetratricopeptide (TPR) repeat protein
MIKLLCLVVALGFIFPNLAAGQEVQALIDRGIENSQKGRYDEAIQDFNQALKAKPGDAATLTFRGVVYHAKGQDDQALKDFDQALNADPKFGRAYYQRGMVYETLGRYTPALKDLEQAKSLGYKVDMDFVEMIKRKMAGEK